MKTSGLLACCCLALLLLSGCNGEASTDETATAHYLANEGVLVVRGKTSIAFDPLFDNSYGQYQLPPSDIRAGLMAGTPPYDGLDAVFISHYHGDHFSPEEILELMRARPEIRLVAPAQAVTALRDVATAGDTSLLDDIVSIDLAYGDPPVAYTLGGILVEAVRIPHAGWPTGRLDVENIAYRVTLDDKVTMLHLGDADPRDNHFAQDPEFWAERKIDMAFPPYWYFLAPGGWEVLDIRLKPTHSVGVHVPEAMPDDPASRPPEYQGFDLFTEPGETRAIQTEN